MFVCVHMYIYIYIYIYIHVCVICIYDGYPSRGRCSCRGRPACRRPRCPVVLDMCVYIYIYIYIYLYIHREREREKSIIITLITVSIIISSSSSSSSRSSSIISRSSTMSTECAQPADLMSSKQRDPNPNNNSCIRKQCCKRITESLLCRCSRSC